MRCAKKDMWIEHDKAIQSYRPPPADNILLPINVSKEERFNDVSEGMLPSQDFDEFALLRRDRRLVVRRLVRSQLNEHLAAISTGSVY